MDGMVYSPKNKVPLFKLVCDSSGNRCVEYYYNGRTELMEVPHLIVFLMEAEMMSRNLGNMIYSPKKKIPLGILKKDSDDWCFIEVKHKSRTDRIRLTTYVKLVFESEALKAG